MFRMLTTCARGIAPVLEGELQSLGFPVLRSEPMAVETRGSLADAMLLNLYLRTCQRVLLQLAEFVAVSSDDLYRGASEFAWEEILLPDEPLSLRGSISAPAIRDPRFAVLKCKDAIVDRLRSKLGKRPNTGSDTSGAAVFVHWHGHICRLYLDTTGEPLHRRGYRQASVTAPMQETLAAAVVLATDWRGNEHFINPMCGSGTLAIEAALIAAKRAPGLSRQNFAFMHLRNYPPDAWSRLVGEARREIIRRLPVRIIASDISPTAVAAARKNAQAANVDGLIEFVMCNFNRTPIPPGKGVVILNPEYGRRMGRPEALAAVYREIGDFFKQRCLGYRGCVFTGNLELAKRIGLRSCRRLQFFNGDIECRLLIFDIYAGSKRRALGAAGNAQG